MIAKRVAAHKKGARARAGGLIRYVVDEKHDGAKAVKIGITHCHSDDYQWAIQEIEAVQDINTRSQIDKTYHLVVSFQEGEQPTHAVLDDIEHQIATSLGYGEHQRVSAVHNDTDHLHLHLVINKVHPERFTVHEPYYDHYQLGELCQRLERKYGLNADNHARPNKTRGSRLIKTEALKEQGITPLNEWLKDKITTDGIRTWEDLHRQAAIANVSLVVKGNGLAFVHRDSSLGVRASAVSRSLSKANLVEQLGDFALPQKTYQAQYHYVVDETLIQRVNHSDKYWADYQVQKTTAAENKKNQLAALQGYQAEERQKILEENTLQRARIKLGRVVIGAKAKKEAYRILAARRKKELTQLTHHVRQLRQQTYEENRAVSWREYLTQKVDAGDEGALKVLRRLKPQTAKNSNTLSGDIDSGLMLDDKTRVLKTNGEVTYRRGKVTIVDAGENIYLKNGIDASSLAFAVALAKAKYSALTISGSDEFKAAVSKIIGDDFPAKAVKSEDPIDAFIAKRNTMADRVSGLKNHRRLSTLTSGIFTFTGLRRVDDRYVLLCEDKETMGVVEIDEKTFNQLSRVKRHSDITLNRGVPQTQGRKR